MTEVTECNMHMRSHGCALILRSVDEGRSARKLVEIFAFCKCDIMKPSIRMKPSIPRIDRNSNYIDMMRHSISVSRVVDHNQRQQTQLIMNIADRTDDQLAVNNEGIGYILDDVTGVENAIADQRELIKSVGTDATDAIELADEKAKERDEKAAERLDVPIAQIASTALALASLPTLAINIGELKTNLHSGIVTSVKQGVSGVMLTMDHNTNLIVNSALEKQTKAFVDIMDATKSHLMEHGHDVTTRNIEVLNESMIILDQKIGSREAVVAGLADKLSLLATTNSVQAIIITDSAQLHAQKDRELELARSNEAQIRRDAANASIEDARAGQRKAEKEAADLRMQVARLTPADPRFVKLIDTVCEHLRMVMRIYDYDSQALASDINKDLVYALCRRTLIDALDLPPIRDGSRFNDFHHEGRILAEVSTSGFDQIMRLGRELDIDMLKTVVGIKKVLIDTVNKAETKEQMNNMGFNIKNVDEMALIKSAYMKSLPVKFGLNASVLEFSIISAFTRGALMFLVISPVSDIVRNKEQNVGPRGMGMESLKYATDNAVVRLIQCDMMISSGADLPQAAAVVLFHILHIAPYIATPHAEVNGYRRQVRFFFEREKVDYVHEIHVARVSISSPPRSRDAISVLYLCRVHEGRWLQQLTARFVDVVKMNYNRWSPLLRQRIPKIVSERMQKVEITRDPKSMTPKSKKLTPHAQRQISLLDNGRSTTLFPYLPSDQLCVLDPLSDSRSYITAILPTALAHVSQDYVNKLIKNEHCHFDTPTNDMANQLLASSDKDAANASESNVTPQLMASPSFLTGSYRMSDYKMNLERRFHGREFDEDEVPVRREFNRAKRAADMARNMWSRSTVESYEQYWEEVDALGNVVPKLENKLQGGWREEINLWGGQL